MKEVCCKNCIAEKGKRYNRKDKEELFCVATALTIDDPKTYFCYMYKQNGLKARLDRWIESKQK